MAAQKIALMLPLALLASAQSNTITSSASVPSASGNVIQVTIPGGTSFSDDLVGSVVGVTSAVTTVVVGCPDSFDTVACDFYPPVTFTAGSNTFRYTSTDDEYDLSFTQECAISADGASCAFIGTGNPEGSGTETLASSSFSTTYAASEFVLYPVTATAGATGELSTVPVSSTSSSSTSGGSSSPTGSTTTSRPTGSTTTPSGTAPTSTGGANALVPGAVAGGLMGLAAVLL